MPARLADGLGLESGLGAISAAPFAPSRSFCSGEFGSPAPGLRKETGLRLLQKTDFSSKWPWETKTRFTTKCRSSRNHDATAKRARGNQKPIKSIKKILKPRSGNQLSSPRFSSPFPSSARLRRLGLYHSNSWPNPEGAMFST